MIRMIVALALSTILVMSLDALAFQLFDLSIMDVVAPVYVLLFFPVFLLTAIAVFVIWKVIKGWALPIHNNDACCIGGAIPAMWFFGVHVYGWYMSDVMTFLVNGCLVLLLLYIIQMISVARCK